MTEGEAWQTVCHPLPAPRRARRGLYIVLILAALAIATGSLIALAQ